MKMCRKQVSLTKIIQAWNEVQLAIEQKILIRYLPLIYFVTADVFYPYCSLSLSSLYSLSNEFLKYFDSPLLIKNDLSVNAVKLMGKFL